MVGTALGLATTGCQGNTIELEDDAGAGGTAVPGDDSTDGGDGSVDSPDGDDADADADADTGPIVTTMEPEPDTGDREPAGLAEGRYLLLATTIVEPSLPLQWEVMVTRDPDSLSGQSLSLNLGSATEPRALVGGVWDAKLSVTADEIQIVIPPLQILGEANPATGSELVTGELLLTGRPSPTSEICGDLLGDVVEPLMLDLTGSTFLLLPAPEGQPWPSDVPAGC